MKISIVTISFNQARYLDETIRSVTSQDYPDLEYIVVDPGSTDGSRDIIAQHADAIARTVFEVDKGPADGLNKGFACATGQVLGFLNSDDLLEPGTLRSVADYFERHPEVDVVTGHSLVIDENGNVLRRLYSDSFSLAMAAYGASILSQPSTFFRRDIFRRAGGFNIDNTSCWDTELFMDMALAGARFAATPEFWSRFRVHGEGITGSGRLSDQLRRDGSNIFRKAKGREPTRADAFVALVTRYVRKIANYRDTIERLRHGPISGRCAKDLTKVGKSNP